ncbi:MAG: SDR family oxidoreductase [Cyclobacteriaceae bacterium]
MDLHLKDKVAIISGSAGKKGSIGQVMVEALANEGVIPALIDRSDRGHSYLKELQDRGIDSFFTQTDVTDPVQLEASVKSITDKYGRIDIVINNVGVNDGIGLNGSYEDFLSSIKLNLASFFMLTKCAVPFLKKSKGNILNIGSKVAITGQGGTSGYAASKGGVLALTREWAVDLLPYGIRSNAIIISESMTPAYSDWLSSNVEGDKTLIKINNSIPFEKRMTTPQEISDTALFLISDRSSHTTGQYVFVDGGYVHLDRACLTG